MAANDITSLAEQIRARNSRYAIGSNYRGARPPRATSGSYRIPDGPGSWLWLHEDMSPQEVVRLFGNKEEKQLAQSLPVTSSSVSPTVSSSSTGQKSTTLPGQSGNSQFNINPEPQGTRSDVYGSVPGATMLPDVVGDLQKAYPQLTETNSAIGQNILSKLRGELSPEVIANLQNDAARFGVQSGMPGSGLQTNQRLLGNIRTTEALQNQGIQDYLRFTPTVSATQTVRPETQIGLAQTNAMLGSAPDPTAAGNYARSLFDQYLNRLSQGGGNPAAATGMFPQAAASFQGLMPQQFQQPLQSRFADYAGNQARRQAQPQPITPVSTVPPGQGFWTPDNFSDLTQRQQNDYWTELNRYSYMDPSLYE